MNTSIALPIAKLTHEAPFVPRCFVVFNDGSREVWPWPFTPPAISDLNAARKGVIDGDTFEFCWCVTLFFPPDWPPDLIQDFLVK